MVRLFHIHYPARTLFLAVSEAGLLAAAMVAAFFLWFGRDAELPLVYEHGLAKAGFSTLVCMLCMYYFDLYSSSVLSNRRETLTRLVQVLGTVCLLMAASFYVYPGVRLGRGLFVTWLALAILLLAFWRTFFLALNSLPWFAQRTLVLGEGPLAVSLVREIRSRPELGLDLVGCVSTVEGDGFGIGLPRLGAVGDLEAVVRDHRVHRILLATRERGDNLPVAELLQLKSRGVVLQDGAELYEEVAGRVCLAALVPSQLLFIRGFHLSRAMSIYKRTLSIGGAIVGIVAAGPLMALIALAVRLDSAGPAIFRQKRVGRDGRVFTMYKFRSMWHDPEANGGARPATADDERITRVGRWLRRTRLDELPQLFNILRGDMYFIGPRPFTPELEQTFSQQIPYYTYRWTMRPGATGWAQVQHGYCETLDDNRAKLSYDLFYIKNISFGLDSMILVQTAKILLLGRGAR